MHTPGQHKRLPAHSSGRPNSAPERMARLAPANTSPRLCRVPCTKTRGACAASAVLQIRGACAATAAQGTRGAHPILNQKRRENKYRCKAPPGPPSGRASSANRFRRRLLARPVCDTPSTPKPPDTSHAMAAPRGGQAGPAAPAAASMPAASCWALSDMCLIPAHSRGRVLKNQPQVQEDRHGSRRIPPSAARAARP
jgi:hypothetical protein